MLDSISIMGFTTMLWIVTLERRVLPLLGSGASVVEQNDQMQFNLDSLYLATGMNVSPLQGIGSGSKS